MQRMIIKNKGKLVEQVTVSQTPAEVKQVHTHAHTHQTAEVVAGRDVQSKLKWGEKGHALKNGGVVVNCLGKVKVFEKINNDGKHCLDI